MYLIEETPTEVNFSLEKNLSTEESMTTIKREPDDFNNRKTENEVDRDLDQKSTIQIFNHIKREDKDFINSQYSISHDEVNIKSDDDGEQSDTQVSANEKKGLGQSSKRVAAHSPQPNKTVEPNKCNNCVCENAGKPYLKNNLILPRCPDGPKMYECSSCSDKIPVEESLKNHTVRDTSKDQIIHKCPNCPYQSNCKGNVNRHSIVHKKPDEIVWHRCTECPYKTKWKGYLKTHAVVHNEKRQNEIFKCAHCVFETSWKHCLKQHLLMVHRGANIPLVYCPQPECPYKTHNRKCLKRHSLVHTNDKFFTQCTFQTNRQENLKSHQFKHNSINKWHVCSQCPYKTYRKSSLRRHNLRHANPDQLASYTCDHCPFKTKLKYVLTQHAITHNMDHAKWLKCTFCSYVTPYKNHLRCHQIKHQEDDGLSWQKCPECPYKTPGKANLRAHAKNHKAADQTDWFQCPECSYRTSRTQHLKAHQMLHL